MVFADCIELRTLTWREYSVLSAWVLNPFPSALPYMKKAERSHLHREGDSELMEGEIGVVRTSQEIPAARNWDGSHLQLLEETAP